MKITDYSSLAILPVLLLILLIPKLRRIAKCYLKYLTLCVYMACIAVIAMPIALVNSPFTPKPMLAFSTLVDPLSKIIGIKWDLRSTENLLEDGNSAIFVSNHQTLFDIFGMLHLWKTKQIKCTAIARNFFFWLWPLGLAMWMGGIVFIKRVSGLKDTIDCINHAAAEIFKKKVNLWVYVEGTRNRNPETLMPFKKGAFRIAISHQVPVIPVVFSPYYFISWKNKYFDSGKVVMEVLEPIPTTGMTLDDLDDLILKTYTVMSEKHKELMNETQYHKIQRNKTS